MKRFTSQTFARARALPGAATQRKALKIQKSAIHFLYQKLLYSFLSN